MIQYIDKLTEIKTVIIRMILILLFSLYGIFSKIENWSWGSDIVLKLFDIHSDSKYKDENLKKYYDFKNKPGGILIFTHCTLLDQYIVYKELNDVMKIVVREDTCVFPYNIMAKRIGHIMVNKNSKASDKIKDFVNERKSGDRMLMIAPSAGYSNNDNQNKLEEFRTGAFLPLTPVLPVIIKYSPYINWKNGQSFLNFLYEILSAEKKLYSFKVLDEVQPKENETPEEFKERVKLYMESEMEKINVQNDNQNSIYNFYNGHPLLLISSQLFLIACISAIYFKNYKVAIGLFIVYLTSIYYHWKGSTKAFYVDIISNLMLGIVFSFIFLFNKQKIIYSVLGLLIFILFSYIRKNNLQNIDLDYQHVLILHIPLFVIFMIMNYHFYLIDHKK